MDDNIFSLSDTFLLEIEVLPADKIEDKNLDD